MFGNKSLLFARLALAAAICSDRQSTTYTFIRLLLFIGDVYLLLLLLRLLFDTTTELRQSPAGHWADNAFVVLRRCEQGSAVRPPSGPCPSAGTTRTIRSTADSQSNQRSRFIDRTLACRSACAHAPIEVGGKFCFHANLFSQEVANNSSGGVDLGTAVARRIISNARRGSISSAAVSASWYCMAQ